MHSTSSDGRQFGHNRHGPKIGGLCPFLGGGGSASKTMWPGPRPTSIPSGILTYPAVWPQQKWAKNWGTVPFGGGGTRYPSSTMWPGRKPTSMPSAILIHPAIWPQQTWAENWGLCPLFWEGAGSPYNTMSLGPSLPPYQVASWSIQPRGYNRYGPKTGGTVPLWGRGSWVPI